MTAMHAGEQAVVLQAASICLSYPDGSVREMLPLVRGAVDGLPAGRPRERLTAFLRHVTATPPVRLVHAFTAPIQYLFRPYIVYRSRTGGLATRPTRRGWERTR